MGKVENVVRVYNKTRTLRIALNQLRSELIGSSQYLAEDVRNLKKDIRRAQRTLLYNKEKRNALNLDHLLSSNMDGFWKSIKKSRAKENNKEKYSANELAEFYSKLFSHQDRPSNEQQRAIEREIGQFYENIKGEDFDVSETFSYTDVDNAISKLKNGKSPGNDFLINEMFSYGKCVNLILLLKVVFNSMVRFGHTPENFNIAMVKPIPKKGELNSLSDYRPISVSSVLALLYEDLIRDKIGLGRLIGDNQFGYKPYTSCKHAYYIVNETINYYKAGNTSIHVASLDASKAFDKLWRTGLFFKLKGKIPDHYWRAIVSYYNKSKICVRANGELSEIREITEGVKQGGILSPFLFNFFINDLIDECLKLNVGAKLGNINVSIIAYCDDIILLSPSRGHLQKLVDTCENFAENWKMKFNSEKSLYYTNNVTIDRNNYLSMDNKYLNRVEGFIHLGLPIGHKSYTNHFVEEKFKKTESSFSSLYSLVCRPYALNPMTIAFIYKQFCQSIFKYGMETVHLSKKDVNEFNVRQNLLIKRTIGVSKFAKTKPLFQVLRIESIPQLYVKHKVFFFKQVMRNKLAKECYNYLENFNLSRHFLINRQL